MIEPKLIAAGFLFAFAVTFAGIASMFDRPHCSIFNRAACSAAHEVAVK